MPQTNAKFACDLGDADGFAYRRADHFAGALNVMRGDIWQSSRVAESWANQAEQPIKQHLVEGRPQYLTFWCGLAPDEFHRTAEISCSRRGKIELKRPVQSCPKCRAMPCFQQLRNHVIGDLDSKTTVTGRLVKRFAIIGNDRGIAAAARHFEPSALIETLAPFRNNKDQMRAREDLQLDRGA